MTRLGLEIGNLSQQFSLNSVIRLDYFITGVDMFRKSIEMFQQISTLGSVTQNPKTVYLKVTSGSVTVNDQLVNRHFFKYPILILLQLVSIYFPIIYYLRYEI